MPHDDSSPAERLTKEFSPEHIRRALAGSEHLKVGGRSGGARVSVMRSSVPLETSASLAHEVNPETIQVQQRYAAALNSLRAVEERCGPKLIAWLFANADDLIVQTSIAPEFVTTLYEELRVVELAHVTASVGRGDLSSLRLVCACHDKHCGEDGVRCSRCPEDGPTDEERIAETMNEEVRRALVALVTARKEVEAFR